MSEHDENLRIALKENARLRSEREEGLRDVASSEYAKHARNAERIYWAYALVCVVLGVGAINFFARSFDVKTLIGCAVAMLVLYETTVLMKLWFATARLKLDVLKEMKLLRLEVARLQQAVGVPDPAEPPAKWQPTRGTSPLERKLWIAACVVVAMTVSTWTSQAWHLGGGPRVTTTQVTLSADGRAEKRSEAIRQYSSYYRPSGFTHYAPKDCSFRILDASGLQLPVKTTQTGGQNRHEVVLTDGVFVNGEMRYTQIIDVPAASTLEDGVWTYRDGLRHAGKPLSYSFSIVLPSGAKVLSSEPTSEVEHDDQGSARVHFEGVTENDKQYYFTVRYELPSADADDAAEE